MLNIPLMDGNPLEPSMAEFVVGVVSLLLLGTLTVLLVRFLQRR